MKRFILLFITLCCLTSYINANISDLDSDNKIDLLGDFPTTGTRSVFEPIILMQYSTHLDATFQNNLGYITIQIFDEMNNLVYQNQINTSTEGHLLINIQNLISGNYTIKFINVQNKSMSGNFVIQE